MGIYCYKFQRLKEKMNSGKMLDDEDFAGLALAPLMSDNQSRKEKIKEAIYYAKQGDTVTAEKQLQFCIHWQINFSNE